MYYRTMNLVFDILYLKSQNDIEKFPKTLREINESMKKVKTEISTNLKELEHVKTSLKKFMVNV